MLLSIVISIYNVVSYLEELVNLINDFPNAELYDLGFVNFGMINNIEGE